MRTASIALSTLALAAIATPAAADTGPVAGFTGDYTWMNGSNYQPASLLTMGPLTWTLMVDTYYGWDFNTPLDHTVFPTTTAPRHNELNLNLGLLGLEVTGIEHIFGKLVLQTGNYVDTITGTDATAGRGAYTGLSNMRHVQQAYAGHHFPVLGGLNLVAGLFPAYIGLDSYIPQENWNYTHNVVSDFTPYYLQGVMAQLYPRPDFKTELWLVNGWQAIAKLNEGFGLGYSVNWRPSDRLSLTHNFLGGHFDADPTRTRLYVDNTLQWKYAVGAPGAWYRHHALAVVLDGGWESAGAAPLAAPAGSAGSAFDATPYAAAMGGGALLHRTELSDRWAFTVRASGFSDPQKLVALAPPGGTALPARSVDALEATATLDFRPSPWVLYRFEYRHDQSQQPYIAGPGGITTPPGAAAFTPDFRLAGDRVTLNATVRF